MAEPEKLGLMSGVVPGDMTTFIREFIAYSSDTNQTHPYGVYYFGVIACATHFESALEDFISTWCLVKSGQDDNIYPGIMEKVRTDVSRTTGLDGWKQWMQSLFKINLTEELKNDWETLSILFNLRNQLAHGRTTKFTHFWRTDGKFVGMTIDGSPYEKSFKYLLQKNVITIAANEMPSAEKILTAKVVLHFSVAVENAIKTLAKLPDLKDFDLYTE